MKIVTKTQSLSICFAFLLSFISINVSYAQDFPLSDFMTVCKNRQNYRIQNYQTDTTRKSKQEFLNNLKKFDVKNYTDLSDLMEMNERKFPESFYITDIDHNGINEYLITETFEGYYNLCYTFKDKKAVCFLTNLAFDDILVESPHKIWVTVPEDPMGMGDNGGLFQYITDVYLFNLTTFETTFKFKILETFQLPFENDTIPYLNLIKPVNTTFPKEFILNKPSAFFAQSTMPKGYQKNGVINKGMHGWILGDTLNAWFTVLDSTTSYQNDLMGLNKFTLNNKGYMMCWIPKSNAELTLKSDLSGLYEDPLTKEYLRITLTQLGYNINYFSHKSFEKNLILDEYKPADNSLTVRFNSAGKKYNLEFQENFRKIKCTNPDQTRQIFERKK